MIPWLYIGVALAAVVGFQAFLASVRHEARAECVAEHLEAARFAREAARDKGDKASTRYEAGKAERAGRERIVVQEVERIVDRPVYRDRCVDDDGLRVIRDRIADRRGAGEPAPAVPAASGPR